MKGDKTQAQENRGMINFALTLVANCALSGGYTEEETARALGRAFEAARRKRQEDRRRGLKLVKPMRRGRRSG